MTMRTHTLARCGILSLIGVATSVQAQSLAARVSAAGNGSVNFHFTARPGVCGDGLRYMRIGRSYQGAWSSDMRSAPCTVGPVQVRLTLRDGGVDRLESWAGTLRMREGRDLGVVSSAESARYLLDIAAHGGAGASTKAILPAVLADSSTVWPTLLVIARDTETRSHATRQDAAFWLSRFAATALAGKDHELLDDDADDGRDGGGTKDLKRHAVFVLSQLPNHEGVPALLDIARSNPDRTIRGHALFWLGQSGDPRALALFESLLRA